MGKRTTKNEITYSQLPLTAQQQQLGGMVVQPNDPSIPFSYAQRREDVNNSMHSPFGANTSPAVRDAAARVANKRMSMDESAAIQAMNAQNAQGQFNRQAAVAGLSAPVQTGGTQTQSGGFWSGLLMNALGAGAQAGQAAMMGGGGSNPLASAAGQVAGSSGSAAAL